MLRNEARLMRKQIFLNREGAGWFVRCVFVVKVSTHYTRSPQNREKILAHIKASATTRTKKESCGLFRERLPKYRPPQAGLRNLLTHGVLYLVWYRCV